MQHVPRCLVCNEAERTIVAEYNRLVFIEDMWQSDLARYDYALCHGCGLVYATRHPDRPEYEFLYSRFNEFLVREGHPDRYSVPEFSPRMRGEIDRQFVPWSELDSVRIKGSHVRKRLRRELDNTLRYLPHITPHVSLAGGKILHLRAKSSTLGDYVKKMHGAAQVDVVTLFPVHQYLAEKNAGIRAVSCLDYHQFHIPFNDKYNLIIDNHILVHMMDPDQTFAEFTSHLEHDGAIFLHAEVADDALFRKGKNLFAELRPFHFQQFDKPVLERILYRYGYEPVSIQRSGERDSELFGVARRAHAPGHMPRIGATELRARLDMYRIWRDQSILWLPRERAHALFGSELTEVWRRVRRLEGSPVDRLVYKRRFREAKLPLEALEIAGGWTTLRRRSLNWRGRLLVGTRLGSWIASVLKATRLGKLSRPRRRPQAAKEAGRRKVKKSRRPSSRKSQDAQRS